MVGLAGLPAQALDNQRSVAVRGEITSDSFIPVSVTVEIDGNGNGPAASASVNVDGTFEFRSITAGAHELRVIAPGGGVLYSENVVVSGPYQRLSIRIPAPAQANRTSSGSISIRQLAHKVPPTAQKAFHKGEQAAAKGSYQDAAAAFKEAVAIDPEYADAYNELGAAEASLKDLPKAAEYFQKAVDLVPEHSLALPNLAIILAKLKRYSEASALARRALQIQPASCNMHFILAASLLLDKGGSEEVLDHLQRASAELPKAHLMAADLLVQEGKRDEAAHHLQAYLAAVPPDDANRTKVEAELARLQK
jgi:tetratricopeptide (TPR) repeat protein